MEEKENKDFPEGVQKENLEYNIPKYGEGTSRTNVPDSTGAILPHPIKDKEKKIYGDERDNHPDMAEILTEGGKKVKLRLKDKEDPEKKGSAEKTSAMRLLYAEKAEDILEKRKSGWTYREIAYEYGVSPTLIYKVVCKELDKIKGRTNTSATQIKTLMEERLEFMWKAIFPNIKKGVITSVGMGLQIMERQAKLSGIDAAEKKQIDINIDMSNVEIIQTAKRLGIDVPAELEKLVHREEIVDAEILRITDGREEQEEKEETEEISKEENR